MKSSLSYEVADNPLAIFDIDGTLCDTQEAEGICYARAMVEVTGVALDTLDWSQYPEPTSRGILETILEGDPDREEKAKAFENCFLEHLQAIRPEYPGDFLPIPGAVEFVKRLEADTAWSVAIATGGFESEARFKLKCCGLDLKAFPYATSSDTPYRKEIIPLAADRAGGNLDSAVYFGDAPWDWKVSQELGIPFIGIGRQVKVLRDLGAQETFVDFYDLLERSRRFS